MITIKEVKCNGLIPYTKDMTEDHERIDFSVEWAYCKTFMTIFPEDKKNIFCDRCKNRPDIKLVF